MDFTLGDALWAVGIVLAVAAVGVVATVFFALGGADLLRGAGRSIGRAVAPRVNRFEPAQEPRPAPRPERPHMSSQAETHTRPIAAVPGTGTKFPVPPVPAKNDLTYDDAVRRAAAIKVGGKWWMSGKKLYSIVGGNHARFLEIVSEVRGEPAPDDVPPAPAAVSPIAGRPIDPRNFQDDPELQYHAP
jgi:hypothetical protein